MNTFFAKRSICKHTWKNYGSKKWHCIDFVMMKQKQWRLCSDVFCAICRMLDGPHKLIKVKLRLTVIPKTKPGRSKKRYAVLRLDDKKIREKYSKLVVVAVGDERSSYTGGENMWEMLHGGVAEKVLGWEKQSGLGTVL